MFVVPCGRVAAPITAYKHGVWMKQVKSWKSYKAKVRLNF
jgi:hypothetical protein